MERNQTSTTDPQVLTLPSLDADIARRLGLVIRIFVEHGRSTDGGQTYPTDEAIRNNLGDIGDSPDLD